MRIWLDEPKSESYARVKVDGKLVSSALRHDLPVDVRVEPGEHNIGVELSGYIAETEQIEAHKTILQEFHFTLRRDPYQLGPPPHP
jgi:hypothetical protein